VLRSSLDPKNENKIILPPPPSTLRSGGVVEGKAFPAQPRKQGGGREGVPFSYGNACLGQEGEL